MINIGLLGCGTVGSGVVKLLASNRAVISMRSGQEITIKRVLETAPHKVLDLGLGEEVLCTDINELLADEDIHIVVELIGGIEPARTYILEAMKRGKHVVTANKDLIAVCGQELFSTAETHGVDFYFEAAVGGGIPVIHPLKQYLGGNHIKEVIGIVNGTTNYILTKMSREGMEFNQVLREAQELGYAEADPTSDVEGYDAARKIAILASIAFNSRVTLDDVYVEGITRLSPLDIEYGGELGYVVKLLAIAQEIKGRIQARVHPAFIPKHHPLAAVNGVYNAVFINGDAVGELMFYGRGAGQMPTASAVVGDIMEIARNIHRGTVGSVSCTCFYSKDIMPIDELQSKFYIRLLVKDRPGVLAAIAGVFGNHQVSIATVLQKTSGEEYARLVLVTHYVPESDLRDALTVLEGMSIVSEISNVIRLEGETR
ncbi:MAG: homoserine dehydrogenase [Syntrophomonadaceae bacterium]|nr:homoserine dehydrogenase [Syntrophomonadaceae bacterium]